MWVITKDKVVDKAPVLERILWRVPVIFSLPTAGPLGQAGTLDVDVQTGQILYTPEMLEDIAERGDAMVKRASDEAD